MAHIRLCATHDIANNQSRGFSPDGGPLQEIFVVNHAGQFHAYRNQCPHTGATLNWQDDQFLDISQQLIQCSVHGALFRISDGFCLRGPCARQSLIPCNIEIINDGIFLVD